MFLPEKFTATTNRHVKNSPADALPVFKRTGAALVEIGGSFLRYSSSTPPKVEPVPGGFRITSGVAQQ